MKHLALFILILVGFQSYAQRKPKISGNRNAVEVKEGLPAFHTVELHDNLEIVLESSATNGYTLVADDNLIDILKFKVEDGILAISSFYNVTAKKKLEITIRYNGLTSIILRDGKMTTKDQLVADSLNVTVFGFSYLGLKAKTSVLTLSLEGSGKGEFNVESDSLSIAAKDRASFRLYGTMESCDIRQQGSAKGILEGTTQEAVLDLESGSELTANDFFANHIRATLQDDATLRVRATDSIKISSRGKGRTFLYGEPKINIVEFLDTSELHKRKN